LVVYREQNRAIDWHPFPLTWGCLYSSPRPTKANRNANAIASLLPPTTSWKFRTMNPSINSMTWPDTINREVSLSVAYSREATRFICRAFRDPAAFNCKQHSMFHMLNASIAHCRFHATPIISWLLSLRNASCRSRHWQKTRIVSY